MQIGVSRKNNLALEGCFKRGDNDYFSYLLNYDGYQDLLDELEELKINELLYF